MDKKNNLKRVLILIGVLAVLLIAFYAVTGAISKLTGFSVFDNKERFKECLKEKDITLFINSETPAETNKKNPLHEYLDLFKIVNCKRDNNICAEKGVDGPFPNWVINNKLIRGDISVSELSESSGCKL